METDDPLAKYRQYEFDWGEDFLTQKEDKIVRAIMYAAIITIVCVALVGALYKVLYL